VIGDSSLTPDSGAVAASRATSLVHRALQSGGGPFVTSLCERAGRRLGCAASSLRLGPGGFYPAGASACLPAEQRLSLAELARDLAPADLPVQIVDLPADETPSEILGAHHVFGACAALAQVALDTWSGDIRLERLLVASALGPVVSAQGYLGQIEGGALMGAGMFLTEDLPMVLGRYQSRNLDGYLIPTLADAPVCEVIAVTNTWPGTRSARGAPARSGVNIGATTVASTMASHRPSVRRLPVRPDDMLGLLEQACERDLMNEIYPSNWPFGSMVSRRCIPAHPNVPCWTSFGKIIG
jgi:CO/xanthine dehydrogenase Mo-binding subunit